MKPWIWPFLLALTIFFASGTGNVASPNIANFDKLAHFLIFGLVGIVMLRCRKPVSWRWALSSFLIVSSYGILDEFRQSFTPGRSVEWQDWMADTLGVLVAVLLYKTVPAFSTILEVKLPGKSRQQILPTENEDL